MVRCFFSFHSRACESCFLVRSPSTLHTSVVSTCASSDVSTSFTSCPPAHYCTQLANVDFRSPSSMLPFRLHSIQFTCGADNDENVNDCMEPINQCTSSIQQQKRRMKLSILDPPQLSLSYGSNNDSMWTK